MSDDSPFTAASHGIYGLTLEELRLLIHMVRETYEQTGRYPSATELRAALRKPGS